MNINEEKKHIRGKLSSGEGSFNLTYWPQDNPKKDQLDKLADYARSKGCSAVVHHSVGWPKEVAIVDLMSLTR